MKKSRPRNQRLSSDREQRQKYFFKNVVKRGTSATWLAFCQWTSRVLRVLALAALVAGAYLGVTHGWRKFFWKNPEYALQEIHFTTDGSLTREQALHIMKLKPGDNIYSYNISAAGDALKTLPQVDTADVRSYPPNRIDITVVERKPVAWVVPKLSDKSTNREGAYLLDGQGRVFQPRHVPQEFKKLPTIGGVQTEDLEPGKRIRKAEVDAALDLLRRTRETGASKVMRIDVSKAYCIVATDQKNAQLTFGLDDIGGQLERLAVVQSETALIGQEIQTVNLIPVRNVPVTFMPPSRPETDDSEEAPPPKSRNQSPPKPSGSGSSKEKSQSSGKKSEPAKSKGKEEPKKDGTGLLKRFRTA